ncbi:LysE family translocator [Tsuneonella sp. HG249]
MLDPERLAAFALMTAATSVVPGVSMLFVVGQTIRSGWRSGAIGLIGMQLGYIVWWLLAGFGLGTLAAEFPLGFLILTVLGALYIAWLGIQSIRQAGEIVEMPQPVRAVQARTPFFEGVLVALSNPKSLVYVVALLPPFVDTHLPVGPQLVVLATIGLVIDMAVGGVYIAAGTRLSDAMSRPQTRKRFDIAVGLLFVTIAAAILFDLAA